MCCVALRPFFLLLRLLRLLLLLLRLLLLLLLLCPDDLVHVLRGEDQARIVQPNL